MKKHSRLFPSQIRYREKNPTVSFQLKRELKEKLTELARRENVSISRYVSDFLAEVVEKKEDEAKKLQEQYQKGRDAGYKKGYNEGEEAAKINFEAELKKKMGEKDMEIGKVRRVTYKIGYENGGKFQLNCSVCKKPMVMDIQDDRDKKLIFQVLNGKIKHGEC